MARRKGKRSMRASAQRLNSIGATDIRRQRGEVVTENVEVQGEDGRRVVLHNVDRVQDYVTRYWRQGALNDDQWKAGRRFAHECEASLVGVRSQLGKGSGSDDALKAMCDAGAVARMASRRASAAIRILGEHAGIAIWVAAQGRAASDWAIANHLAPPEGIRVLRLAFTKLSKHYGVDIRGEPTP